VKYGSLRLGLRWIRIRRRIGLSGSAGVGRRVFVSRVLLGGPLETDLHRHIEFVDFVNRARGLKAGGDYLKSDGVADRDHVDDGLAVLVGFELESTLILVALDGMKDDMSVVDWLAVVVAHYCDFNSRGGRRHLVFAAMMGVIILGAKSEGAGDEA